MAELLLDIVVNKLFNIGFEYLQNKFPWHIGMKKELEKALERLRDNHPKIQAFVSNARRAQIIEKNPDLNEWIWKLREAIDEAADLLDEIQYHKYKEQLDENQEENKVRSYVTSLLNEAKRICVGSREDPLKRKPNLKRLDEVVQKLDIILAQASPFLHLLENEKQEQREQQLELHKTRETGSLPGNDLIGRGKEKEFIIEWLRKPSNEEHQTRVTSTILYKNISLLSIVGHGGMGKTTLLQHVFQDKITVEFDLKMWVCVSDSFDAKQVIADMLEYPKDKRPCLESLQKSLKSKVMSKNKFLLVLDDLWGKEEEVELLSKWENVFAPLAYGGMGSKILITTRMDHVASMITKVIGKKKEILRLEGLEEDECLQILTTYAFADVENPDDHKKLKFIAGELVTKLYGSPLAAKVMGGVLNSSLDERHWINVLNNSLSLNGIFPILKLSYIFLPEHLQNCFSFCSIFKQDHVFDKDDLVRMWIAVGFIQSSHIHGETLTLRDIGESYFDVLIKKSFFDKVIGSEEYNMHDLLHELAQHVSKQECFRFVGNEMSLFQEIPKTIRHLSVEISNPEVLKKMGRFKNLRTLFIISHNQNLDNLDALNEIFKVTRSILLLYIHSYYLQVIPDAIGYLVHLRYLKLICPAVKLLPRSLSSLYHLQFITVEHFGIVVSNDYFPRDMNKLCNLRHLGTWHSNFPGIGKLKFLEQLYLFNVKNENGYRIEELKHMNDLRCVRLNNLRTVRDAQEALNAKLCDKRKLTCLGLNWKILGSQDIANYDLDERVLDNLQPHNYLKKLIIISYMGARSARWMNEVHLINNLEEIHLYNCLEWEILPPFGKLPFLKTLDLYEMSKVKRLECCDYPSLEILHLNNLEALVDWFDASVVDSLFPCLTKLRLSHCPNLQELPYLPPKLESLKIDNIGWKTLNCCSISKSIPPEILDVSHCSNTSISLAGEIGKLKKLKHLAIKGCPNLISLGEHQEVEAIENCLLVLDDLIITDPSMLQLEPLRSSTSIRKLIIEDNDELVSFSLEAEQWFLQVNSSLRELKFKNLRSLLFLPSTLTSISSLEILELDNLSELRELPDFPPSLKKPIIKNCDPELMKRYE